MFFLSHLFCGLLIGAACILPGASGGAFAVSLGVYGPVLKAVNRLALRPKESIRFLFPFALGGILGLLAFTLCLEQLFFRWPLITHMVFLGLLMGGAPSMGKEIFRQLRGRTDALSCFVLCLIVSSVALWLALTEISCGNGSASLARLAFTPSFLSGLILFLTGFLSAATVVIPGVSGSMLLMMLGLYQPLLFSVTGCLKAFASGSLSGVLPQVRILLPLALGLFLGVFFFARIMETVLNRRPALILSAILGLLLSSPAPILRNLPPESLTQTSLPCAVFFFSISLSAAAFWMGKNRDMVSS